MTIKRKPNQCVFYDSVGEFLKACPTEDMGYTRGSSSFTGYQTYAEAKKNATKGKPEVVKRSDKIMQEIEADGIELEGLQWGNDVAGFIPCVPSFISGAPDSMRRPMDCSTDKSPIKVYASFCASAGVTAEQLEKRGVAILSLCRKLQAIRPVELWIFSEMYGYGGYAIPVIRIETSPLDLTSASYAMADAGFLRQLGFAWGYDSRGFDGGWAWEIGGNYTRMIKNLRELFEADDKDLILPGTFLDDKLLNKPVEWVNEQVLKYTAQLESA